MTYIYYDDTTTERYRIIVSIGKDNTPIENLIAVAIYSWPAGYERRSEVYYDTITEMVIPRDDIPTEVLKQKAREYVITLSRGVFSFIPIDEIETAITYVKNRLSTIKNATTITEITTAVSQIENQVNNILEGL